MTMPEANITAPRNDPDRRSGTWSFDKSCGLRIRRARVLKGWTQSQLAERLGVAYQQVHKYETGYNRVTLEMAARIAAATGATLDWLAGRSEGWQSALEFEAWSQQQQLMELAAALHRIDDPEQRRALIKVAAAMGRKK